jgi:hypothetical protein
MDLRTFSNELTAIQLPAQQKTRSMGNDTIEQDLIVTMTPYFRGIRKGTKNYVMEYKLDFPIGTFASKTVTLTQIKKKADDFLKFNVDRGDEQYVDVTKADLNGITYSFNHEKWFKANFKKKGNYIPPTTVSFKYWSSFPRLFYVNKIGNDMNHFIEDKFLDWVPIKYLENDKFVFVKKLLKTMFVCKWNYVTQRMEVSLKYEVVLGSLALYMSLFHGKDAKKTDLERIKREAIKFSSVKNLDKIIKKY